MTRPTRLKSSVLRASLAAVALVLITASLARAQAPAGDARLSATAEYLLWWMKDSPASPPLVSTGRLGDADFSVVLGGRDYAPSPHQGARFTVGHRLDPDWALEGVGFFLPTTSVTKTVTSSGAPGSPRLVVPVFRVDQSQEGRLTIASAGEFFGDARESLRSGMHGAELNVTRRIAAADGWTVAALGGFRYLRLGERLAFSASSVALDVPDVFDLTDVFETTNRFYGAQIGATGELGRGGWFARGAAKVGLGVMRESLEVAGTLFTNDFNDLGAPQAFAGGIFAQPTNIGRHDRDRFAVVSEAGLRAGYRMARWASVFVGYTFLHATAVVRPGSQIDRNVNATQAMAFQVPQTPPPALTLEGPARPAVRFPESDFWAQGLDIGVSFTY
jgi:putative beta barrel porin BBP7